MSHLCLLGVATLTLTSAGFAGSDTNADLQARLEAAEARISELSAASNTNWLNDARANEIRGLVHDVLADADTRANLQGSGATAGYNNGFTIGSADGNWSLTINGLLQERWINSDIDLATGNTVERDHRGFENTRTVLNFSGTIAGDYGYDIRLLWSAHEDESFEDESFEEFEFFEGESSGIIAEWAYGTIDMGDGWSMDAGLMKLPINRAWMINAEHQLAVERSFTSTLDAAYFLFGPYATATSTGVMINYDADSYRFWVGYFNGLNNAPAGTYVGNDESSTWIVRGEWMIEGTWDQFDEFTSANGDAAGTLIGFSYRNTDWGDALELAEAPDDSDSAWSIDAQLQFGGANVYVLYTRHDIDLAPDDWNPSTFELMGGLYLNDDWEIYARYQELDIDISGEKNIDIFTFGVNYYMAGHNAKWTTDISWANDGMLPGGMTGWVFSDTDEDQTLIRTQLQFYF